MHVANYCTECGAHLKRKRWRAWLNRNLCEDCARRRGRTFVHPLAGIAVIAIAAFALGRYLRPAPPPLVIERAANSPLSDLPVNLNKTARTDREQADGLDQNSKVITQTADEKLFICGARTKKGTPCKRRVHVAGERCYQHKGRPAILPLEKLAVKGG